MENVFSHTAGAWARGVVFLRHMFSVVVSCFKFLLSVIADEKPQFPPNPSFELKTYALLVRYSILHCLTRYCNLPILHIMLGRIWFEK